jgi:pyrroline-5-carboxylate reductase
MMHVLLVGCGKMGGALLAGWQQASSPDTYFTVIDLHAADQKPQTQTSYHTLLSDLPADYKADIIMLAVKPSQLDGLLPDIAARFGSTQPLYISIAAGKTVGYFKQHLGDDAKIVRVMPNTPSLVGKGMSIIYAPDNVPSDLVKQTFTLMQAVGETAQLTDETLMDAATAISGSGPAYVFYLLECLSNAGVHAGLDVNLAQHLALHTINGASELALQSPETFEQLRKNVTSPGGTTEAALAVLMQENGLEALFRDAVTAAKKRASEL